MGGWEQDFDDQRLHVRHQQMVGAAMHASNWCIFVAHVREQRVARLGGFYCVLLLLGTATPVLTGLVGLMRKFCVDIPLTVSG